jgi:hypothetical protein
MDRGSGLHIVFSDAPQDQPVVANWADVMDAPVTSDTRDMAE